ncbi:MAG TPA: T9SS type A sorting domain-containing protein [Ignavibacteria bacterium]|nr:T9SS type A sorting domain-containing protein [Ignavibacteria bacterium]
MKTIYFIFCFLALNISSAFSWQGHLLEISKLQCYPTHVFTEANTTDAYLYTVVDIDPIPIIDPTTYYVDYFIIQNGVEHNVGHLYITHISNPNYIVKRYININSLIPNLCFNKNAILKVNIYASDQPAGSGETHYAYFRVYHSAGGGTNPNNQVCNDGVKSLYGFSGSEISNQGQFNINWKNNNCNGSIATTHENAIRYKVTRTISKNSNEHIEIIPELCYGFNGGVLQNQKFWGYVESQTETSATLITFVYKRQASNNSDWWPCSPENAVISYKAVNHQVPIIQNLSQTPNPMCPSHQEARVYCNLAQGTGTITYHWEFYNVPKYFDIESDPSRNYVRILRNRTNSESELNSNTPVFYLECRASNSLGVSQRSKLYFYYPNQCNLTGCPTLEMDINGLVYNENSLLLKSPSNPEQFIDDYYVINNPELKENSLINLRIHEPDEYLNELDMVKLLKVEVNGNSNAAVTEDGEIISYSQPEYPGRIIIDKSRDVGVELNDYDNLTVEVSQGTKLTIDNNVLRGFNGDSYLIMRVKAPIINKELPIGTIYLWEKEFANIYTRHNDNLVCVKLQSGIGNAEIIFDQDIEIDQAFLTTAEEPISITELPLSNAKHNVLGDVTEYISNLDNNIVSINRNEDLSFTFNNENITETKANFILLTNGRYFMAQLSVNKSEVGDFKLNENYPNPFNPITNISFSIPSASNVSLKVFDITGKEVAKLVNEYKSAGDYSIQFNASELSSGVYFYRLNAGNFMSTKRMLLIK